LRCLKDKICTRCGRDFNTLTISTHRCQPRHDNPTINGNNPGGNNTDHPGGNNNLVSNVENRGRNNVGNDENIFIDGYEGDFGNGEGSFLQPEQAGPNQLDNLLDSACTQFEKFIEKQTKKTLEVFSIQLNNQMKVFGIQLNNQMKDQMKVFGIQMNNQMKVFGTQLKNKAEDALNEFQTELKQK
jgi:hypothetical protein